MGVENRSEESGARPAAVGLRMLLSHRVIWIAVLVSLAIAGVTTTSYISAFIDPASHVHDLPLAITNQDQGATVAGRHVNYGAELVGLVTGSPVNGHSVQWAVRPNRSSIIAAMNDNRYDAAVVIPPDFSARVAAILGRFPPSQAATIEVLTNKAAGSIAYGVTRSIALSVVNRVSSVLGKRLQQQIARSHSSVPIGAVGIVAQPLQVTETVAEPIPAKSADGLAPLYMALTMALAGFFGAQVISTAVVGFVVRARLAHAVFRPLSGWKATLVATVVLAVAASTIEVLIAVGLFGMGTSSTLGLIAFGALSVAAIAALALAMLQLLGPPGMLAVTLIVTIFGVPSSGASWPSQTVPTFFRVLGEVLPLGYVADGIRSILFFHGRWSSGLGRAVLVLSLYIVGGVAVGTWVAMRRERLAQHQPESSGPAVPPKVEAKAGSA